MLSRLIVVALVVVSVAAEVRVFGNNKNGQLGVTDEIVTTPTTVKALDGKCLKQAAVTSQNSIFVTCDGEVYVGGTGVAANGAASLKPESVARSPVLVEGLRGRGKVAMVGAGDSHFVVLMNDGRVFTWGHNQDGQLGYGNDVPFSGAANEVTSLRSMNIRLISAGGNRTAAVSDDGKLFLWGAGTHGEMGDGTSRSHRKPTLVTSFLANRERICQVAIGSQHVAAVTTAGDMYTWGDGSAGQLGLGSFGMQEKKPMPIPRLRKNVCFATAGEDFTAVVTQDERVFLWGSNGYPNPFEKTYFQGKKPRQISSGSSHMVVLSEDGSLSSWGSRRLGQAGRTFSGMFSLEPGMIDGILKASQIATGDQQTIVLINTDYPAPSLCPCLNLWYGHWRQKEQYKASCTDEQVSCGDDSCCAKGHTCCPIDDRKQSSVLQYLAIDEKPKGFESSYRCVAAKDAVCCDATSSLACPNAHICNLKASPKRCEPSDLSSNASDEEIAKKSEDPLRSNSLSGYPGAVSAPGVCGARKETCPDDTCCAKGQTCCPMDDGSFGCCQHANGVCCKSGCCADGFTCDDEHGTCVEKDGKSSEVQIVVDGHCGGNKIQCPDRSCCPDGSECCVLNDGFFGCCPFKNGLCCADGSGCCPNGHSCDIEKSECVATSTSGEEVRMSMKATPRNMPSRSGANEITCSNGMTCQYPGTCCNNPDGRTTCCDFVNGTCCAGFGCCPAEFECDVDSSSCKPIRSHSSEVPMKFTRDAKPKVPSSTKENACKDRTQCADGTCCSSGSTCCKGEDGQYSCCASANAVCCKGGGCCSAGHLCDSQTKTCRDTAGLSYTFLSESQTSPAPPAEETQVNAPGKCYLDEMKCQNDFCCPRGATCCDKGFGQHGCCPHTHGVCCEGGGCCPGGSTCNVADKICTFPNDPSKTASPMLTQDVPTAPSAEWDKEECLTDEQTCSVDGSCCLKTESCCTIDVEGKKQSACCPFADGICCGAGCCPAGSICEEGSGICRSVSGEAIESKDLKGSTTHPLDGVGEIDCPDGTVCDHMSTCCSLGVDEDSGEEFYGCCPFENAVCCKDFEGCCPSGYDCNAESQSCSSGSRDLNPGGNSPSEPPPTFVCLWPQTQCPNFKCCEQNEFCAETAGGNYKCIPRGYTSCFNGTGACPDGLYCERDGTSVYCAEEVNNDLSVKEAVVRRFWGDEPEATCNSLIQTSAGQVDGAPHFWYPKKLVVRSKATNPGTTSLPTLLAAKVCQHLPVTNTSAAVDFCYLSNSNGHFLMKERDRVQVLVSEYARRLCIEQNCIAPPGPVWSPVPEDIDPCPCRQKPSASPLPTDNADESAGEEPQIGDSVFVVDPPRKPNAPPPFLPPTVDIPDEKPVSPHGMGTGTSGAVPVSSETPVDSSATTTTTTAGGKGSSGFTLVVPVKDAMQVSSETDLGSGVGGDEAMLAAKRAEIFMGKESCNDNDGSREDGVDADDDEVKSSAETSDLSQMEANVNRESSNIMPEVM